MARIHGDGDDAIEACPGHNRKSETLQNHRQRNPQDLSGKGRTDAPTERSDGTMPVIKAANTFNRIKKEE
jgi:hypothetical protein